mgnify:CR=1 FL=1
MIPGLTTAGVSERPRLYGVYPALVTDVQDPDNQGRVQIKLPLVEEADGATALAWARLATLMAGGDRGSWFIPEVDDEVLVAFTAGDPRRPVVIGALWNGVDAPPETMDSANNVRSVTSRSGHKLSFDDTAGAALVVDHYGLAQLLFNSRQGHILGHRRDIILQFFQLSDVVLRQQVTPGRQDLPDFHKTGPQEFKGQAQFDWSGLVI